MKSPPWAGFGCFCALPTRYVFTRADATVDNLAFLLCFDFRPFLVLPCGGMVQFSSCFGALVVVRWSFVLPIIFKCWQLQRQYLFCCCGLQRHEIYRMSSGLWTTAVLCVLDTCGWSRLMWLWGFRLVIPSREKVSSFLGSSFYHSSSIFAHTFRVNGTSAPRATVVFKNWYRSIVDDLFILNYSWSGIDLCVRTLRYK